MLGNRKGIDSHQRLVDKEEQCQLAGLRRLKFTLPRMLVQHQLIKLHGRNVNKDMTKHEWHVVKKWVDMKVIIIQGMNQFVDLSSR